MPFPLQQRAVLVADDEPIILAAFERAFRDQDDFILDTANTVALAIQKIRSVRYHLIFLDVRINGSVGGLEILDEFRRLEIEEQAKGKPFLRSWIIIMSASVCWNDIADHAHKRRVFCFIDKPVDFSPEFVREVVNQFGLPLLPPNTIVDPPSPPVVEPEL